jgi:hypothetical protein
LRSGTTPGHRRWRRRRTGVVFPDGKIAPGTGPRDPNGRYMVTSNALITEIKVAAVNGHVTITGVRPVPRFVITGPVP